VLLPTPRAVLALHAPLPPEILELAAARSAAGAAREWSRADDLREKIPEAGSKVVDEGSGRTPGAGTHVVLPFALFRAPPPDVLKDGILRHGPAASAPSALDQPATAACTVILVADAWPDDLSRALAAS